MPALVTRLKQSPDKSAELVRLLKEHRRCRAEAGANQPGRREHTGLTPIGHPWLKGIRSHADAAAHPFFYDGRPRGA